MTSSDCKTKLPCMNTSSLAVSHSSSAYQFFPLFLQFFFFFFNDTATTEIYTLSLHDALPISGGTFADVLDRDRPIRADQDGCSWCSSVSDVTGNSTTAAPRLPTPG